MHRTAPNGRELSSSAEVENSWFNGTELRWPWNGFNFQFSGPWRHDSFLGNQSLKTSRYQNLGAGSKISANGVFRYSSERNQLYTPLDSDTCILVMERTTVYIGCSLKACTWGFGLQLALELSLQQAILLLCNISPAASGWHGMW